MDRRAALKALGAGVPLLFAVQGRTGSTPDSVLARLANPEWAGRSQSRVTAFDNDAYVVAIEQKLRCTCGCNLSVYTCRTTDFTCTTSPALHQRVIELYQQHQTAEQILAAFVAEHGETVLMAPPRTGFNLAAYYVPGIVIAVVGSAFLAFVVRRSRRPVPAASGGMAGAGLSAADAARLEDELRQLDR